MVSRNWLIPIFILAVILLICLRVNPSEMINIDEIIPLKVAESMQARGSLDPNWALADLPEYFKYDQYNFYLYSIVSYFSIKVGNAFEVEPLSTLRYLNVFLQACAVMFVADTLRRLGSGIVAIVTAAIAFLVFPLVTQDATMARPESLIYLLAAVLGWLCAFQTRPLTIVALIGFVTALGIATKFNFFVFASPLFIFWLLRNREAVFEKFWLIMAVATFAGIVGIVLGMPYAIINFDSFTSGVKFLLDYYDGGHPPHSRAEWSWISQSLWISAYFIVSAGVLILITLVGGSISLEGRRLEAVFFFAPFLLFVLYFSTKTVFFERNFAQALPSLIVAFGLAVHALLQSLKNRGLAIRAGLWLVIAVGIFQMAHWTLAINNVSTSRGSLRAAYEQEYGLIGFDSHYLIQDDLSRDGCGKFAILEFNDPQTRHNLETLKNSGFTQMGAYKSVFALMPTSTLHTYLDANIIYMEKPC